ncbi:hypothetical protein DYB32_006242 [Aphanomyces invadans]|uniref:Reverse transcriptase Ty1/copia-type domain-containing protein n=1 Tax=Aphanomyces invadans TaxID=157072 RepID=A0A418ARX9_9STRA|nr:hypothetical protein DYB32_006242 [Aphanomyces invadans]
MPDIPIHEIMFKPYQDPVAHPAARSSRSPTQVEESLRSSFRSLRDNNESMINRLEDNPTTPAPTRRNATEAPSAPKRASSRFRKPNPRYLNFAANVAERPLDTSLEGYHQEEIQEDSATARDMVLEQADAVNAYIQAKLERPNWAVEPEGYVTSPGKVALVKIALYGLNKSGHEWEVHCKKQIAELGWKQSSHDPCVFTRGRDTDMKILGTWTV